MKIMTRKNSAYLMPLLLFFYLAMSPVALANDTGIDVNVIAPDGDIFLNMVESGGIAARFGGYRRLTPREDWRSTPSEGKFYWENNPTKKITDKVIDGINRVERRQECLEREQKYCQSTLLQNPTEKCHLYALRICQPRYRKRIQEVQDLFKE